MVKRPGELTGKVLGRYRVGPQLGRGGMASVYLAQQEGIDRQVAIKVMRAGFLTEDKWLKRFEREVQVITKLQHPRVLPVYDFGEYDDRPYIVMAYLAGGTIADHIRHTRLSVAQVIRYAEQAAEALDYAHRHDVIHRDFKPGNLLLDDEDNVHLADFGIAKLSTSTVSLTGQSMLGTPAYMAPEMAQMKPLTYSADIYALGVTLYHMLTRQYPFAAETPLQMVMAHITQPVPDVRIERPDLPWKINEVIRTAMAKDPGERYQNAGDCAEALAAAVRSARTNFIDPNAPRDEITTLTDLTDTSYAEFQLIEANPEELVLLSGPGQAAEPRLNIPIEELPTVKETPVAVDSEQRHWVIVSVLSVLLLLASVVLGTLFFVLPSLNFTAAPINDRVAGAGQAATQCGIDATDCFVIPIGAVPQIAYIGPQEQTGVALQRAAELALSELGAGQAQLQVFDTTTIPATEVAEIICSSSNIVGVIGPLTVTEAQNTAPTLADCGVVTLSASVSAATISGVEIPTFNRIVFSDADIGAAMARTLPADANEIVIIHDETVYSVAFINQLTLTLEGAGHDVIAVVPLQAETTPIEMAQSLAAQSRAQAFVYAGGLEQSQMLLAELPNDDDIPLLGTDALYSPRFFDQVDAAGRDIYTVGPAPYADGGQLNQNYQEAYGTTAFIDSPLTGYSYDAVGVLLNALRQVGFVEGEQLYILKSSLLEAVRATNGYQGVTGTITCDATGECFTGQLAAYEAEAENGFWELLPNF